MKSKFDGFKRAFFLCSMIVNFLSSCDGGDSVALADATITPVPTTTLSPSAARWSDLEQGWTYFENQTPDIIDLQVDHQGNLWATTEGAVYYLDIADSTSQRYTACGEIREMRKTMIDSNGDLWIITSVSIVHWQLDSLFCIEYSENHGIPSAAFTHDGYGCAGFNDIVETMDGTIWVGTCDGIILKFDGLLWNIDKQVDRVFREFFVTKQGNLIAIGAGLTEYNGLEWKTVFSNELNASIYTFAEDQNGALWFATQCCDQQYATYRLMDFAVEEITELSRIIDLQSGPDGVIWFEWAYYPEGPWNFQTFDGDTWGTVALPMNERAATYTIAPDGTVWLYGHFLYRLKEGAWLQYSIPNEVTINLLGAGGYPDILASPDGSIYIKNNFGAEINRFDGQEWTVYYLDQIPLSPDGERRSLQPVLAYQDERPFTTMYPLGLGHEMAFDQDGYLWINYLGGVVRFDGEMWEYHPWRDSSSLRQISFDSRGILWGIGFNGLVRWVNDQWIEIPIEGVNSFAIAPNEETWVAANPGIVVLASDGLPKLSYTTENGLPDNEVKQVVFDLNGIAWAATETGVARLDGERWVTMLDLSSHPCEILTMSVTPDNLIWVDTCGSGILYYDGVQWQNFGSQQSYLLPSPDGYLWVVNGATQYGSSSIDHPRLCRLSGAEYIDDYDCYSTVAGANSIVIGPDGSLWMTLGYYNGSNIGLVRYMPSP